jgi:uncharacterized protein YggE
MRSWTIPVAVAGGLAIGVLGIGVLAAGNRHAGPRSPLAGTALAADATTSTTNADHTITVDAVGTVSGQPDTVTINLGVQTRAKSAADALNQANIKAQGLINTLKANGVADKDITTTDVSVYPQYDIANRITGYTAGNSVTAKLHDLTKAGVVIDAAAGAVGDAITMGGISFSIDDTSALYTKARQLAMTQAKTNADTLARAGGATLGPIVSIREAAQYTPTPQYYAPATTAAGAADSKYAVPPIQPGQQNLQLTVTVVYELQS